MNQKIKKGTPTKVIIIAVLAVAILGGIYADMTKTTPVQTGVIKKGTIRQYIEERARTTLPHIYHITMPEQGRVLPITLTAGTPVKKGQLVVQLDPADLADAMTESREVVTAMVNAVQSSLAQIQAAQAQLDFSKWLWEAKEKLYKQSQTSELEAKKAQREFLTAKVELEEDQSTAYAMQAMLSISKLFPIYVNRRLKRTEVTSPIDGTILKRYVWNEQVMQPGDRLVDIGNLSSLQITADILTEEAVQIAPGDTVEIYGEAIGDTPIHGTVDHIKPQGFTKVSSLGVEQQRVPVLISFNKDELDKLNAAHRSLGLEYRVHVRIITATRKSALTIPRTALFRGDQGDWQAFTVKKGKAELVTLQLGIVNDHEAEVLSGLSENDVVIIAPESTLKAGARVSG